MALRHKVCRDKRQKKHSGGQNNNKTRQRKHLRHVYSGKRYLFFIMRKPGFNAAFRTLCQWVFPENFDTIWSLRSPLQIPMVKWVLVGYLWSSNTECRFPGPAWMLNSVAADRKGCFLFWFFCVCPENIACMVLIPSHKVSDSDISPMFRG